MESSKVINEGDGEIKDADLEIENNNAINTSFEIKEQGGISVIQSNERAGDIPEINDDDENVEIIVETNNSSPVKNEQVMDLVIEKEKQVESMVRVTDSNVDMWEIDGELIEVLSVPMGGHPPQAEVTRSKRVLHRLSTGLTMLQLRGINTGPNRGAPISKVNIDF